MRAVQCKQFGPPESLVLEDVDDPVPAPGQVVVDVHACGVNFPDVLIIQNRYQFEPPLPFSPGAEVSVWCRRWPRASTTSARAIA